MDIPEIINIGSFLGIMTITGFAIKTYKSTTKIKEEVNNKVNRNYQRMDEVKEDMETKLQSKEICDIHIKSIDATLQEIKMDVKILLKNNGH